VVRATEREAVPAGCFGDSPDACCIAPVCGLRGVLREAVDAFYAVLDRCTLADLVQNRGALAAVLFTPKAARDVPV
jgi:Rrf2 family transcriptional regulator, nitric oxide-sensitive transcriptional repressor